MKWENLLREHWSLCWWEDTDWISETCNFLTDQHLFPQSCVNAENWGPWHTKDARLHGNSCPLCPSAATGGLGGMRISGGVNESCQSGFITVFTVGTGLQDGSEPCELRFSHFFLFWWDQEIFLLLRGWTSPGAGIGSKDLHHLPDKPYSAWSSFEGHRPGRRRTSNGVDGSEGQSNINKNTNIIFFTVKCKIRFMWTESN